jgi:hypothetical protein
MEPYSVKRFLLSALFLLEHILQSVFLVIGLCLGAAVWGVLMLIKLVCQDARK